MRILGIDFGERHIGLAVSDRLGITAQPLAHYQLVGPKADLKYFRDIVAQYDIQKIVVGLPLQMDGTIGPQAEKSQKFGQWLENALKLPVIMWDERLTTKQAVKIMDEQKLKSQRKKQFKDRISATLILSNYLDNERRCRNDNQTP